MIRIDEVFSPGGPIARKLGGYEPRPGQVQMAQSIERGFLEGMHTLVEAGTGVGKSLAYLVPAMRSGKKIIISTGTIALQEQLVQKDIPLVLDALGTRARVCLLKGRNHYLCKQKFQRMQSERLLPPNRSMQRIWEWESRTVTGDRAELPFLPSTEEWEALDADADDCVGEFCEHFRDCFFFRKRDDAKFADIVVVNHALFFLDLAMGGGLLPAYDFVILDEAHQCQRWATAALTATLSRPSVGRLMRKLHRTYHVPSPFDAEIEEGLRGLMSALARVPGERYRLELNDDAGAALGRLRESLYRLENWLYSHWDSALRRRPDNEAEAQRRRDLAMRPILAHIATIERAQSSSGETIAWAERAQTDGHYEINSAPCDVADYLRTSLFERVTSVVLTSATIAQGASFAFLRRSLGVAQAQELIAPSPFDYRLQARLFIAPPNVNPKAANFARMAAPLVEECLDRSQGRSFVLFTSYTRLREVYAIVRERIAFPVRLQGEMPRAHLLEWFRSTKNAVLFATGTFWEGIDVVGDQLSCVIIDRLPFPSPADPLVAARMEALEARGVSGFEGYMVPAATVRLKQGFGRLIRSKTDRGLVALLDGRATGSRYGKSIIDALPQAKRIDELSHLEGFFQGA